MLPAAARLRHRDEFSAVFRRGRRAGRGPLVVHMLPSREQADDSPGAAAMPRVGFVIGRPVGGAVVRNRVRRRLRHLLRDRLASLPAGADFVVRVLPGAGELSSAELARQLDAALRRLLPSLPPSSGGPA